NRARIGAIEVDACSPWSPVALREEAFGIGVQIISSRSEVIVDDVDEDHETERVRTVDQALEIIGCAIGRIRCVWQDTVIAPIPGSCEIGERQQFDRGYSERLEILELACEPGIG